MEVRHKIETIEEIKRIERELYLKKSRVASIQAMKCSVSPSLSSLIGSGLDTVEWKRTLSALIRKIGETSIGGDSVADIRTERAR